MIITFYSITDDSRKINKQLNNGVELDCKVRTDINIYDPTFLIKNFKREYNYLLFDGRYYFINSIEYVGENRWNLSCHIDVLMTYKDIILNTDCKIKQSTNINPFYNGNDYNNLETTESDLYISDTSFPEIYSSVLLTLGG